MRLIPSTIRSLSLPPGKSDCTYFDDEVPGFGLRLRAGGAQSWLVQYAIGGRTRRMTIGSPAVLDPGKAREQARTILAQVRLGRDPAREKTNARHRAAETLGALLPRFLERQRGQLTPRSFIETQRHLAGHLRSLHGHSIESIDRRTIAMRLAEIAEGSGPAAANRTRTSLSAFFSWAAREGLCESNPVTYTNVCTEQGARARVLSDDELVAIWRACDGQSAFDQIARLLMLTGARRTEIGGLRWDEVDLEAATITLPAGRTKNKREHVIPLSRPALAILAALPRHGDSVFGRGRAGFRDWGTGKRRLDARIDPPLDHWTLHDFRRSLSTSLHERFNAPPHVVEALLGHVGHQGGVAGVYNRANYLDERRRVLERWGAHLESLVTGEPVVVQVARLR